MKLASHSTDTNEIRHLINRVKQGELDQGDALFGFFVSFRQNGVGT